MPQFTPEEPHIDSGSGDHVDLANYETWKTTPVDKLVNALGFEATTDAMAVVQGLLSPLLSEGYNNDLVKNMAAAVGGALGRKQPPIPRL